MVYGPGGSDGRLTVSSVTMVLALVFLCAMGGCRRNTGTMRTIDDAMEGVSDVAVVVTVSEGGNYRFGVSESLQGKTGKSEEECGRVSGEHDSVYLYVKRPKGPYVVKLVGRERGGQVLELVIVSEIEAQLQFAGSTPVTLWQNGQIVQKGHVKVHPLPEGGSKWKLVYPEGVELEWLMDVPE